MQEPGKKKLVGAVIFAIVVAVLVWHPKEPTESDAVMAASKAAALGSGIAGAAGPSAGAGPTIAGCPVFPADNVWNTPIDKLQKDKHSVDYIQRMGPALSLHPNFGSDPNNGIPITIVKPNRQRIPISFLYGDESDPGHYPTPEGALVEGGWNSPADSDRHVIMIDEGQRHPAEGRQLVGWRRHQDGLDLERPAWRW